MVLGAVALLVLVPLEHREVGDPEPRLLRLVDQVEPVRRARGAARRARARSARSRRRAKSTVVPGSLLNAACSASERNFSDRRARLAVLAVDDVGEPLRAPLLRELGRARRASPRGNSGGTRRNRTASAPANTLNSDPRVTSVASSISSSKRRSGLSRAEAAVGLGVGEPRERRLQLDADALAPDRRDHPLHQPEQELLVGERHLDVELGDLLHAVGAEILVAEADRDLVVALEAGDDEQLLRDLRRLRQRVELARAAGAPARGSRARPRASASRGSASGCRRSRPPPSRARISPDHLAAQADVALQLVAAQVEPAVAHADVLVDALVVELERQRRRAREDLQLGRLQLDLARRDRRVDGVGRALDDRAARADHELVAQLVRRLGRGRRGVRVDHDLDDAALVAQVDEDEPAEIAPPRDPARERDLAARRRRGAACCRAGRARSS